MKLIHLLDQPFPISETSDIFKRLGYFGFFVFAFILFFKPFGLQGNTFSLLILISVVYGLITFTVGMVTTFGLRRLFPSFFYEKQWTLGKELLITMVNLAMIGFFNLYYTDIVFQIGLSFLSILLFQFYTLLIGIFPITFFTLIQYRRLLVEHLKDAKEISQSLTVENEIKQIEIPLRLNTLLKNGEILMTLDQFIYAESADNYVTICYLVNGQHKQSIIRNTLTNLEKDFQNHDSVVRCHRAYIINLIFVEKVTGNAQGLTLRLKYVDKVVPVSRKMVMEVKNHLKMFVKHP